VNEGGEGGGGTVDVVTAASGDRGIFGNAGGKLAIGEGGDGATANGGNDVVEGAVAYGNGGGWDAAVGTGGDCETSNGGNGGVRDSGDGDGNNGIVGGTGVTEDGGGGKPWTSKVSGDGEDGAGGVRNIDGGSEDWNGGGADCGNGGGMASTGVVAGEYGVTAANMIVFVFLFLLEDKDETHAREEAKRRIYEYYIGGFAMKIEKKTMTKQLYEL